MDEFADGESGDVRTWQSRIARAARTGEARALAVLIKGAAPVAAISGRMDLLKKWLDRIPTEFIENDPQLLYWSGTSVLIDHPADAHPRLLRAFELLDQEATSNWTLMAWAGLLDAIYFWYRDMRELDPLLEWMSPEREAMVDRMARIPRSLVVGSALFAFAFRAPLHPRMSAWRERAERLIEVNPVSDLGARLVAGLVLDYTWRGNLAAAAIAEKRFEARASQTTLSAIPSVMQQLNRATLRLHEGRTTACLDAVARALDTTARVGVRIWDGVLHCHGAAAHLSRGEIDGASQHFAAIEQLFAEGIAVDEAYLRAMLLTYAFVKGDHVGVSTRAEAVLTLTDNKGVPYLMAVSRVITGLILFDAGHQERGRALLVEGLAMGEDIGNPLIAWIGGLFRAHMAYAQADDAVGDAALSVALAFGRAHGLLHFPFFWPRQIITNLIDRGLERGFTPEYLLLLTKTHELLPGSNPARSDAWAFRLRVYTFGVPRVVHADGQVEPLSAQFSRQVELLAVLLVRYPRSVPLSVVAKEMYGDEGADPIASVKRVLHSLRSRLGAESVIQRDASLSIDFRSVWIDAVSFERVRHDESDPIQVERWLDRHYAGHFLEGLEGVPVVQRERRKLTDRARESIAGACAAAVAARDDQALARLRQRWDTLFPDLF